MMILYTEILYRPLFNAVVFLYNILPGHDFGLAIIALTTVMRILFFPLSIKTIRSQKAMSQLSPKLQEIKQKFKDDKSAQSIETMKLYKENNINPLAGCLPLLIQLPIIIGLQAFIAGLKLENLNMLYAFVANPGAINKVSFGFIDITSKMPLLAIFAGGAQFVQAWTTRAQNQSSPNPNKQIDALNSQMLYFFPIMIIVIGWNLPAGLILYWIITTVFSILEQLYVKYSDRANK